ncbi:MAG: hypothetical protein AAFP00_10745, partial [Bacteroidota bacterium]
GGDIGPPDSGDDNNNNLLEPDEIWVYTRPYETTVQDKFEEQVINQATVTAIIEGEPDSIVIDLSDDDSVDENEPTVTTLPSCPSKTDIAVVKTGVAIENIEAGPGCNLIVFNFTVTNEGENILENVVLNDPLLGGDIAGPISGDDNNDGFLDLDEAWVYSVVYDITQEDIGAGFFENQATVIANLQGLPNQEAIDLSDDNSVLENDPTVVDLSFCAPPPDIGLIKEGIPFDVDGDGCIENILYTFTVTNLGDVDLEEVLLEDPLFGGPVPGPDSESLAEDGILQVNEVWTYTALYALTQQDIDNGVVVNQATVTAKPLGGEGQAIDQSDDNSNLENDPARTEVPEDACPGDNGETPLFGIALIKTGEGVDTDNDGCDDSIRYDFTVINAGSTNLENVEIQDELLGGPLSGLVVGEETQDGVLQPGEEWRYTVIYNITQEDIDGTFIDNQASAIANPIGVNDSISDLSDDDSYQENE